MVVIVNNSVVVADHTIIVIENTIIVDDRAEAPNAAACFTWRPNIPDHLCAQTADVTAIRAPPRAKVLLTCGDSLTPFQHSAKVGFACVAAALVVDVSVVVAILIIVIAKSIIVAEALEFRGSSIMCRDHDNDQGEEDMA